MRIIDTSVVLAAVERRSEVVRAHLSEMTERSRRSFVVAGELEFGVCAATSDEVRRLRERSRRYYRLVSEPGPELSPDDMIRWFGVVSAIAQSSGIRIGQNDRWIVAEALAGDLELWTADETMHRLCVAVADHPAGRAIDALLLPSA